jgi:DeoR/GlpR family transcriptional regulator of sugar metabolism
MSEPLFVEERRRAILEELRKNGRVSVKILSEALHVSTVTIRQDLRALEDNGLLDRTYGGAVSRVVEATLPELSFHVRQHRRRSEKTAIAQAAAALVQEGYSIALDASTTAFALVPFLKSFNKITVLTNSLVIAQSFLDSPQIQVLLPGGRLRRDSISIVGRPEGLPDVNLNLGFFSGRGVTLAEGVSDVDPDEVTMKQAMVARCISTVIIVDGSKWGQVAPYTVVKPTQIDRIITSQDAPEAFVEQYRRENIEVILAASS